MPLPPPSLARTDGVDYIRLIVISNRSNHLLSTRLGLFFNLPFSPIYVNVGDQPKDSLAQQMLFINAHRRPNDGRSVALSLHRWLDV